MNALTSAALLSSTSISPAPLSEAELIRLCNAHASLIDAYNGSDPMVEMDDSPTWAAYVHSRDAIGSAQPQTMAGVLAKARAAKAEARTPDGQEDAAGSPAEHWLLQIATDLLRLADVPASDDAGLLAAVADYEAFQATSPVPEGLETVCGTPECEAHEARVGVYADQETALFDALMAMPASTLDGMRAKARAVRRWNRHDDGVESLLDDLLRAFEPVTSMPSPDAPLIAACEEYLRCQRAFEAADTRDLVCAERGDEA